MDLNREKTLDYLRGLAVFQVVFVHTIYWLDIIKPESLTVVKSFTLFEMSLFFFVTGAVNSLKDHRSYGSFCIKRIRGLMIPYYIYSAVCIGISVIYYTASGEFSVFLAAKMVLSWLIPVNTQIMPLWYFTWALWFVPVYLVAIVFFPLIKRAVNRFGRTAIAFQVLIFIIIEIILNLSLKQVPDEGAGIYVNQLSDIIRESFFYMIFMGTGVLYPQLKMRKKKDLAISSAILISSAAGLLISALLLGDTLDMQINKFPANHVFLCYSFAFMTVLYLAMPLIKKMYRFLIGKIPPTDRFFITLSENSITVFLYQSFAFWMTGLMLTLFNLDNTVFEPFAAILLVYPLVWLTIKIKILIRSFRRADGKSSSES